jgi:hypothetical protein
MPPTIATLPLATRARFAISLTKAALAFPATGGSVTRTNTASSRPPRISSRAARG